MDILGLKYFTRSAFKFLRGTAREGKILSDSVAIIKNNVQNTKTQSNAEYYDLRICRKNAFYSIFLHGIMFFMSLTGVWWCGKIGLMWSGIGCLGVAAIFGMYGVRSIRDYEYMTDRLREQNE